MRPQILLLGLAALGRTFAQPTQHPLIAHPDNLQAEGTANEYHDDPLLWLHRKLIEIESISGDEYSIGTWLASFLRSKNFTVERQEVEPRRFNVFAYMGDEDNSKTLVTSHIDTVPPYLPYELRSNHTEIWGRGSVDAKACVAAQITAVLKLLRHCSSDDEVPSDSISMLFVVGEETAGDGMRHFSTQKTREYKAVVFGEPTEGKLAAGHKGILGMTIKVKGRAAHSGYPWLGVSANDVLVRATGELMKLRGRLPQSEKYGETTLNVGRIDGGVAANVVAEQAEAMFAVRIAAETPAVIKSMILEALNETATEAEEAGGEFAVEFSGNAYAPVDIDHDIPGFDIITVNYGTDVPNLTGNHKRYLYGPGSILVAHSDHEHLAVEELERAVDDYQRIILATLD
ncbi:hypothetical protein BDY21DRAFT_321835 [Lineolata rhizophorae]|uniref:Peptidase M20 dimerisation domain-containing protein n=1 Tax=Lineolata rhizophorae TaxID=578093 RepID=A0A6A6NYP9_9PEZI|nr:hypothetical protein BDY21DRAFT_321835 [Lineolata rhizophorae]